MTTKWHISKNTDKGTPVVSKIFKITRRLLIYKKLITWWVTWIIEKIQKLTFFTKSLHISINKDRRTSVISNILQITCRILICQKGDHVMCHMINLKTSKKWQKYNILRRGFSTMIRNDVLSIVLLHRGAIYGASLQSYWNHSKLVD